jgi:hypothetical protein
MLRIHSLALPLLLLKTGIERYVSTPLTQATTLYKQHQEYWVVKESQAYKAYAQRLESGSLSTILYNTRLLFVLFFPILLIYSARKENLFLLTPYYCQFIPYCQLTQKLNTLHYLNTYFSRNNFYTFSSLTTSSSPCSFPLKELFS